jgi:endonuclease/exonuclease/phosphatase family metal-dependent hydrolase
MVRLFSAAVFGLLSLSGLSQAAAIARAEAQTQTFSSYPGTIEVVASNPPTFKYSTSQPDGENWIGIYNAGSGGPDEQKYVSDSIHWDWAPNGEGTVELPSPKDGNYRAFFLAKNGYSWIALPVDFVAGPTKFDGSSFSISSTSPLSFKFSTSRPNSKNWVGVYFASGGGPDRGTMEDPSIVWKYAGDSEGTIEISTEGLGTGAYRAYFLANDGYEHLASPVTFTLGDADAYPGAIARDLNRDGLSIRYTTLNANAQNWIGIYYASGGGPDDGTHNQDSISWDWAPSARGTVNLPTDKLSAGAYKVYFLENGGYKSLAEPLAVTMKSGEAFSFIVDKITTHNARQGDEFTADISQLVNQPGDPNTKFLISELDSWAVISEGGVITGTPRDSGDSIINAQAENNGNVANLEVRIPVRGSGEPMVEDLRVLSFNLWHGGTQVNNYHEKQIQFLVNSNVDVVGLQESTGGHGTRLAHALGWYSWQGDDVSIISRYPIDEVLSAPSRSGAVRINLDGKNSQIVFWNCHLGYTPYGPYDFCFDQMSYERVMEREAQSGRTPQIKAITSAMETHIANADNVPVFLLGDFNAPSHLDWTDNNKHCGVGYVDWPTSIYPTNAGLEDSFRIAHPDPALVPGITWSPVYLENNGRKEPLDRIDFVYHKSRS